MTTSTIRSALVLAAVPVLVAVGGVPAEAATKSNLIVMTITSSTGSRADIDWYSNSNSATLEDHATPWTKRVSTAGYVHSIGASDYSSDEQISLSCSITYRGRVVRHSTVTGTNVHVNCEFDE